MAPGEGPALECPMATGPVRGDFRPPGSKSLTQRWLLLAALASGRSTIRHALRSDDVDALAGGLRALGADISWTDQATLVVEGCGGRFPSSGLLHAAEGGTPARVLMAAAAMADRPATVDGSDRLRARPMRDGAALLEVMGARVRRVGAGELPLEVCGGPCFGRGGEFQIDRPASSQFVSAVALLGPWLERGLSLRVRGGVPSASYVALTVQCLRGLGVAAIWDGHAIHVPPGPPQAFDVTVEPDASSAAYGFAVAALVPGSRVHVPALSLASGQPDVAVARALSDMGSTLESDASGCTISHGAPWRGGVLDASDWPDGSLAVMAVAAGMDGVTEVRGLSTLAAKESDRVASMQAWLEAAGAVVERGPDWIRIRGPFGHGRPVLVDTMRDHRVAMSAAVAGALRGGVRVADPRCVDKSWPGFWRAWADLLGS